MTNRLIQAAVGAAFAAAGAAICGPAHAADLPVKAPAVQSAGWYFWADGSAQSVHLPRFDLGWHYVAPGPFADQGPTQAYDPRARGAAASGAIGHYLPNGTLPALLGTNARFEVGGSYLRADQAQSGASPAVSLTSGFFLPLLNGTMATLPGFCGVPACFTSSTLSTAFTAWHIDGKLTTDYRLGAVTLSPSIAVFGGRSHVQQAFGQQQGGVGAPPAAFYAATVDLGWSDIGARFGLDGRLDVTSWLGLGLGGSVGGAHRDVSLLGSDAASGGGAVFAASAVNASTNATPFLGNAEARLFVTPWSNVTMKGFAGLNYDSKVPGISATSYTLVLPTTGTTPASIKFQSETSYYAGAGLVMAFP